MNEITKVLAKADETFLISLANKGVYKRACKDTDGMMLISHDEGENVIVEISGETVKVSAPLEKCSCTCVSRTVCRHIIGAIILLRQNLTEEDMADTYFSDTEEETEKIQEVAEQKEEEIKVISKKEVKKINSCSSHCIEILGDILKRGLVRIPETSPENLEISAVQCHALKMADAERAMRNLGIRLRDCLENRASFSINNFTEKLCYTFSLMEKLCYDDFNPDILGTFRRNYENYSGHLTLIPIGQRSIAGGEYEGEIYYFLNPEENRNPFLSLSDIRPVFYDTNTKKRTSKVFPWGMAVSLDTMMKRKLILSNAKISEGSLSTSKETIVIMNMDLNLNCDEIRNRIYCDFRQIIVELYEKNPQNELERMMFIHPQKCISADFDKHTQQYNLVIEDGSGFRAFIRVKYREETKKLVELVERIGNKMLEETYKDYTIFASVFLEKNELVFYPIEIYDFIEVPEYEEYWLPDEYEAFAKSANYSDVIMELLDEVQSSIEMTVQCGLQSGSASTKKLENNCFNYGLKGLSIILRKFSKLAESYRHNPDLDIKEILYKMLELEKYISTAKKKLEIILTLNRGNKE